MPVTANPEAFTSALFVPKIDMLNEPEPDLKIPVEGSDAKLSDGLGALPLAKEVTEAPACTVFAL